jgi:hypothetical protein
MGALDEELSRIVRLVQTVRPADAEQRLRALVATMGEEQLRAWEPDFRTAIAEFLPRRRRDLEAFLDRSLRPAADANSTDLSSSHGDDVYDADSASEILDRVRMDLDDLSRRHIFQWATAYRDRVSSAFDDALQISLRASDQVILPELGAIFAAHTAEIFRKGYAHEARQGRSGADYPITKSLSGLQRFLDIPIELYATRYSRGVRLSTARLLRTISSALLAGIIEGFSEVDFGGRTGARILSKYVRSWGHALAFLTAGDLRAVVDSLGHGEFSEGVTASLLPLATAIDEFAEPDYAPLPALAQVVWDERRIEVGLHPPREVEDSTLLRVYSYFDPAFVGRDALAAAVRRDVAAVVAPMRADVQAASIGDERLARIVVDTSNGEHGQAATADRCRLAISDAIFRRRSAKLGEQPLRNNFAREFPLQNPFLTRYFRVHRSSVRELLRTFERRSGVRLWCSIRRSGKTTACIDLAGGAGDAVVVTQTCESTGQIPEGNYFYQGVCEALEAGRHLPHDFLLEIVRRIAPDAGTGAGRFIFVLDEYETLFGRLRWALRREPDLRYPVVQPMLNQLVEFAKDHLIVLLGQQPNAHHILMDQNQLSPYVEQDPFPLFSHGAHTNSEFSDLVRKVLTQRVVLREGFLESIFGETGGHPYLTVNLLTELVEWLIDTERRVSDLALGPHDFQAFANSRLVPARISTSTEYSFFRAAVADALSEDGRIQTPWLHAIYTCMQVMCAKRGVFGCSRREFQQIVADHRLRDLGFTPETLLSTGAQANFLAFKGPRVWPRIRLLGRIAAVTPAAVAP